jgi:hypothetical protein
VVEAAVVVVLVVLEVMKQIAVAAAVGVAGCCLSL